MGNTNLEAMTTKRDGKSHFGPPATSHDRMKLHPGGRVQVTYHKGALRIPVA